MADQQIRVLAEDRQWEELKGRPVSGAFDLVRIWDLGADEPVGSVAALIILMEMDPDALRLTPALLELPILVNAVVPTLASYPNPRHIVRMNAWPGSIASPVWELSASEEARPAATKVLDAIGWSHVWVADLPGLVTPRVISLIIREARLALAEGVSTREEIDTAMSLGTHYPFGPFEWEGRIGKERVDALLLALAETDARYADALQNPALP